MDYVILINPGSNDAHLHTDSNSFKEMYNSYQDAKDEAEELKSYEDYFDYEIFVSCTDECNYPM